MVRFRYTALILLFLALLASPSLAQARRGGRRGAGNDQPTTAATSGSTADAKRASIQTEFNTATQHLEDLKKARRTEFESSDEYKAARQAVEDATTALNKARDQARANLKSNADYQAALNQLAAAKKRIADLKASNASHQELDAATTDAFNKSAVPERLETAAFAADPAVQKAIADLKAAKDNSTQLIAANDRKLKEDPEIVAATAQRDTLKTKLAAANVDSSAADKEKAKKDELDAAELERRRAIAAAERAEAERKRLENERINRRENNRTN